MKSFALILRSLALALLVAGTAAASDKVDINTADAAELDRVLVNVGPSKAATIVEHRNAHGPFKSLEELALVKGIGLKTVEKNRDRIQIGRAAAASQATVAGKEARAGSAGSGPGKGAVAPKPVIRR